MNDIVIYPSKGKMAFLAFGLLALAAMCGSEAIFHEQMEVPVWAAGVGAFGALIMMGGFFWTVYRLMNPAPSVVVNRDGITDNAAATSVGLIRWEEISQITVFRMNGVNNLGILLVDREAFCNHLPSVKASLLKAAWRLTNVPVSIPQSTLPVSAKDLADQIIAYRRALLREPWPAPPPQNIPAPPPPAPAPAMGLRCPACGSPSQGAKFCPNCGQPLPSRTTCSKCGTTVPPGTKFCLECGSKIV